MGNDADERTRMDLLHAELRLAALRAAATIEAPATAPTADERAADLVTVANAAYWWLTGPHRAFSATVRISNITSKNTPRGTTMAANTVTDGDQFDFELDESDSQGQPALNEDADVVTWVLTPDTAGTFTVDTAVSRKGHFVAGTPATGVTLVGTSTTGVTGGVTFDVTGGPVVTAGVTISNIRPKDVPAPPVA